jgi:transposase
VLQVILFSVKENGMNTSNNTNENSALHRHDLSDSIWAKLEPHLPGRRGTWGGVARDNRKFINAVFWILRTGAPWRDLPPEYGSWSNTHRRFIRWRNAGVWERLLEVCIDEPDLEWLMVDASYVKAHQHAGGGRGGNEGIGLTKGGETPRYIWPLIHMVYRSESLSLRVQSLIAHKLCPSWKD